jgi:hypothetical protein
MTMNIPVRNNSSRKAIRYFGITALFSFTAATAQVGVIGDTGIDASGNYQQERAWCLANTLGEEQASCLRNSGAAQAEKRRGTLDNNGANFGANALLRCDALATDDRAACQARVMGYGSASGSVQSGGIIKQIETVTLPENQIPVIVPKPP